MLEIADVLHQFGQLYIKEHEKSMPFSHKRVIFDIMRCRTRELGGHVYKCEDCGKEHYVYHACRNRHCPACHNDQTKQWLEKRQTELLDCDYFHVTVTVPQELRSVFRTNQSIMYSLLFECSNDAINELTQDKRYLGATVGILGVLHTWASNLTYHPHVHLLVTGGGVDPQSKWVDCKNNWLVPIKALSKLIRGKLAARLKKRHLEIYEEVSNFIYKKDWVVHSIHYDKGKNYALKYLSRYVFRTAITNSRIVSVNKETVTYKYKDRKANLIKTMTLSGKEFIRRFLEHTLPKGFHKVRYFGLWHSSSKHNVSNLQNLQIPPKQAMKTAELNAEQIEATNETQIKQITCPHCKSQRMVLIETLPRPRMRSPTTMLQLKHLEITAKKR